MSDDLISRQAAIEAIDDWWITVDDNRHPVDVIKALPTAQPEIIRCKDCRYANECHKSVQYTRNEPNAMTIGYLPIEWCSRGKRREECMSAGKENNTNDI